MALEIASQYVFPLFLDRGKHFVAPNEKVNMQMNTQQYGHQSDF